jgi:hypothetical protein
MVTEKNAATITGHEAGQVERPNATGLTPVVSVAIGPALAFVRRFVQPRPAS